MDFAETLKKMTRGPPITHFWNFIRLSFAGLFPFSEKKLTGVPLDKAFLLLLEGQIPWLLHKKILLPLKNKKSLFPYPFFEFASDKPCKWYFLYLQIKNTMIFFTYILWRIKHKKNKQYKPFYHHPIWKNRELIKISKIFIMIQSMDVWFD